MRRLLLWCAQNPWLAAHVPRWRFARRAVKRFMPGEGFESALKSATEFRAQGVGALFTLLGENINDLVDAGSFVEYGRFAIAAQRFRRDLDDLIARTPADGLVAGTARINGNACAVLSYDYTVLAGTQGALGHRNKLRLVSGRIHYQGLAWREPDAGVNPGAASVILSGIGDGAWRKGRIFSCAIAPSCPPR